MKKSVSVLLLLWSGLLCAASASEVLQQKLSSIHTMSAAFNQVVHAKESEISQSSGNMALARPGRFLWHTRAPMAQHVIADGQHFWVYDVDLEQVTVQKQGKGLDGAAGLFLSDDPRFIARDFHVSKTMKNQQEYYTLKAISPKANFQEVVLVFSHNQLVGLGLFDQLGQRTEVRLSKIKMNPALSPKLFHFSVPKGVDVVRQ